MSVLTAIFFVMIGGATLVAGGEILVRGASKAALGLKISPLVVGLTIVAICTSAPEMAVSFSSAIRSTGENAASVADVALGNVVGSNICNIMLILGFCALFRPLKASNQMVFRDCPTLIVLSAATLTLAFFFRDANGAHWFPRWIGFVFLGLFALYEYWTVWEARRAERNAERNASETVANETTDEATEPQSEASVPKNNWAFAIVAIFVGLFLLVGGSRLFVDGAVSIARDFGVSELIIGLTLVAIGTSLPELTVSAVATYRGQVDVALGNVVGSNICNLLLVLGGTLALLPGGMKLQTQSVFIDIPIMFATTALASWFCFTGRKLERWEGAILLAGQAAYTIYLTRFAG